MRGTVRSHKNEEKTAHLQALNKALPGNLTLYEAGLAFVFVMWIWIHVRMPSVIGTVVFLQTC